MNEYQKIFVKMKGSSWNYDVDKFRAREELRHKYAFAVPNEDALTVIAEYSPIIEIGAGTGYWAYLLREMGVEIEPFDLNPPSRGKNQYKMHKEWVPIKGGGPNVLKRFPKHTLFLCWPPYDTPMGYKCLKAYEGKTLLYIGEGTYGCTGNGAFHNYLGEKFEETTTVPIPQWGGIHDCLSIWVRKPQVSARIRDKRGTRPT